MTFTPGRPILLMLVVAALCGGVVAWRGTPAKPEAEIWTFAQTHADLYEQLRPEIESQLGRPLTVRLIPSNALNVRLVSLLMADRGGSDLPDLVEIRQDAIGRYLGPPADEIGFLPLNRFLDDPTSNWRNKLGTQRLQPYTKQGQVFGLPRDIHPTTLTYRADFFAEAGVDLESPTAGHDFVTWPDFQDRCVRFQNYWRTRGVADRYALDLFSANADILAAMLLQRGVNLIDADGRVWLNHPQVVETLLFYASLVAGPKRISTDSVSGGRSVWQRDLEAGVVCGMITPDWRIADLKQASPKQSGRWRMTKLPRFSPSDAPTTTWGGTMVAIPRRCRDPIKSWQMIESLYLSQPAIEAQTQRTGILPAASSFWQSPTVSQPDPYFADQPVLSLYASLAHQIPVQYLTPDTVYATAALSYVLSQAVSGVQNNTPPDELRVRIVESLAARQADVQRQIAHGRLAVTAQ